MVFTRSGTEVRHPAVRFKRGTDVRRVLEYDEDDWPSRCRSSDSSVSDKVSPSVVNGGILVNKSYHHGQCDDSNFHSPTQSPMNGGCTAMESTILYDTERRYSFMWLWDSLLFTLITLACYTVISNLYSWWGHRLYLTLTTLLIVIFSYNVAYFDSTRPGVMPPSPLSPTEYRQVSGHTYHLTYLMSIVNGLTFLIVESYIRGVVIPPV